MFDFFRRKRSKDASPASPDALQWTRPFPVRDGYPRFDREAIGAWIADQFPPERRDAAVGAAVRAWLDALAEALDNGYNLYDTGDFLFLTQQNRKDAVELLKTMAALVKKIDGHFAGLRSLPAEWPLVVVEFEGADKFWHYASHYFPPGSYAAAGAMMIPDDYPLVVMPPHHEEAAPPVLAHELSHLLRALSNLPLWVEEALAIRSEAFTASHLTLGDMHERGSAWRWSEDDIQLFWAGKAFFAPGEMQPASYRLAKSLLDSVTVSWEDFVAFCGAAKHEDAGLAAAREHLGVDLGELAGELLGEGDWTPDPARIRRHSQKQ